MGLLKQKELVQWLRDNSSGVYRPCAQAANLIERDLKNDQQYKQALEAIKNHIEYSLKDKCEYSATWQIANRALNEPKSIHTEAVE